MRHPTKPGGNSTIKLPASDPHSTPILAWMERLPIGDISALVRQALACSPLVQGSDVRPHLDRIEAKLDRLLAQPTPEQSQAGETMRTPPQEPLSPTEHEALNRLFDFGG